MIKRTMDAFIFFCLVFQVTEAFDKFLTFRESNRDHWTLVCTAEDNGDALVWNIDSNWKGDTIFKSTYTRKLDFIDCPDLNNNCNWHIGKWNQTDWKQNPMGLVLDNTWEGFREYNNFGQFEEQKYVDELPKEGALAFSIRGTTEAEISLCTTNVYRASYCYSINIGKKENSLKICTPQGLIFSQKCKKVAQKNTNGEAISPTEWRHYVLTWNGDKQNVTLYNDKKQLLTYVTDALIDHSKNLYLFHKSPNVIHIRYHQYSYAYTKQQDIALDSSWVNLENNNLCFRLAIGLCAKCSANISLYAQNRYHYKEKLIRVNGNASIHGLPTWQYIKVNITLSETALDAIVLARIMPFIEGKKDAEGFWAVRDIMKCPPQGTMKISSMKNHASSAADIKNPLPNITCQKISYTQNEVIEAHVKAVELETDDYDCPNGTLCSLSCKSFNKDFNENCQNIAICDKKGCTCYIGLTGDNCNKQCDDDKYGYMCKKTCGRCLTEQCNIKTGLCPDLMCDNKDVYRIPPYCDIEIDPPPAPTILSFNETNVHANVIARDEYKRIKLEYNFVIKNEKDMIEHIEPHRTIFQNTTTLDVTVGKLKPGTFYWISCNLIITNENIVINGFLKKFKTLCSVNANFEIDTGVKNLTIMANIPKKVLYSCPFNLYNVTVETIDTKTKIREERMSKKSFLVEKLEPGTAYKVIISNDENGKNVSFTVHTKNGVPSPVQNLRFNLSNNVNVYLAWDKPKTPNGTIKEYEVILNITTYRGCLDLKRDTRPKEFVRTRTNLTNITFCDLQPYITYTAIIYAWNTNRGKVASANFSTGPTNTSRFYYTNLRKEGDKLVWDPPEDCTIISGPIKATKLEFIHPRKAAESRVYILNKTYENSFNLTASELYGREIYEVFVYPILDLNEIQSSSAYTRLVFETPPKAPPRVKNLEIVEVNTSNNSILLRWQEPFPPNGKIDYYNVANCFPKNWKFYIKNVPKNNYCPLWDNYICATITQNLKRKFNITVYAINENVKKNGEYAYVRYNSSELVPDRPENVTAEVYRKTTVTLSWLHPWKTRRPLEKFLIRINVISTKLRHPISKEELHKDEFYSITTYQRKYSVDLDLIPSTQYKFFVIPVTIDGKRGESNNASLETPASMAFEEHLVYEFYTETMICLKIPKITYETKNSTIYFVVKGNNPCKEHVKLNTFLRRHVNVKSNEVAWLAATSHANEYSGNEFCVGDNTTYPSNCPLTMTNFYTVIVIVQADENSTNDEVIIESIQFGNLPIKHNELWAVPLVIILIITAVTLYIFRRRIRKMPTKKILTHKNVSIIYKSKDMTSMTPNLENSPLCQSTADIASLSVEPVPSDNDPIVPIKVKDFEDYVKNAVKSGLLDEQYKVFPRGLTKPCNYGKLPENIMKNRYKNLLPYDETRVILEKLQNDPFSDYINANYIKGYNMEKRYIATQGPKPNTVVDFWRMIWQKNVLVICMLANIFEHGKAKCEQYWPDVGKKKKYGDVKVFNVKHDVFADYTFRMLHVTCDGETRQVKHLHYTTWPDHGVPMYTHSAVTYLKTLLATQIGCGPVVVHCSAGVGRTGTIILCDICLRRAAAEGVVDVFSETQSIRNQRVNMVDNKQQYLFAHLVLLECLLAVPTSLPCDQNLPTRIKDMKEQLNIQFQRLEDTMWQNEALRPTSNQTLSELNMAKHRHPELISKKVARIYLRKYPLHAEDSDYIAAVYVDGLKEQNQYLASQLPMPSTFSDFWRMVAEFHVELIVVLQPPDPNDPTCCPIVPTNDEFKPTPYLSVTTNKVDNKEFYISHKLKLVDNMKKFQPEQSITILSFTKYKPGRNTEPPPVEALVKLWQATERIARNDSPTVVLCHDGVTGCGLYLALSYLLEKMAIERECDVCLAIRTVKRSRPDFIRSIEQMEYLYDAALTYAEYFKTYANFS